LNKSRPGSLVH